MKIIIAILTAFNLALGILTAMNNLDLIHIKSKQASHDKDIEKSNKRFKVIAESLHDRIYADPQKEKIWADMKK